VKTGEFVVGVQVSPLPGNPTPPMTPVAGGPPSFYQSTSLDHKPPAAPCDPAVMVPVQSPVMIEDPPRLTFLVRDAPIMPPFRLEHNFSVSKLMFVLSPHDYNQLVARSVLWPGRSPGQVGRWCCFYGRTRRVSVERQTAQMMTERWHAAVVTE